MSRQQSTNIDRSDNRIEAAIETEREVLARPKKKTGQGGNPQTREPSLSEVSSRDSDNDRHYVLGYN